MISLPPQKLKEILVGSGFVSPESFDLISAEAERKRQNIFDIITSQGIVNKDYLMTLIADSLGVKRINLSSKTINEGALKLLPEDVARRRRSVVFDAREDGSLDVAMEDPTDLETIDFLKLKLGRPIRP